MHRIRHGRAAVGPRCGRLRDWGPSAWVDSRAPRGGVATLRLGPLLTCAHGGRTSQCAVDGCLPSAHLGRHLAMTDDPLGPENGLGRSVMPSRTGRSLANAAAMRGCHGSGLARGRSPWHRPLLDPAPATAAPVSDAGAAIAKARAGLVTRIASTAASPMRRRSAGTSDRVSRSRPARWRRTSDRDHPTSGTLLPCWRPASRGAGSSERILPSA